MSKKKITNIIQNNKQNSKNKIKNNKNWMDLLRLAFKESSRCQKNRKRDFQGR